MGQVLTEQHRAFLEANHTAVMATVDGAGRAHAVPVLCALVGEELWSSGTDLRVRTRHLEARPVAGPVEIRRDARVEDNLRLYRIVTGRDPDDLDEYRAAMVAERRLVYVLTPERVYPSAR